MNERDETWRQILLNVAEISGDSIGRWHLRNDDLFWVGFPSIDRIAEHGFSDTDGCPTSYSDLAFIQVDAQFGSGPLAVTHDLDVIADCLKSVPNACVTQTDDKLRISVLS